MGNLQRSGHRTPVGNRIIPGKCSNLDEAYGNVVPGQHFLCLLKDWRSMDSACIGVKHSGADYWQSGVPGREPHCDRYLCSPALLATDIVGDVALRQGPVIFARYGRLSGLGLYYLVILGELINVDFTVFRFSYSNPYMGLTEKEIKGAYLDWSKCGACQRGIFGVRVTIEQFLAN